MTLGAELWRYQPHPEVWALVLGLVGLYVYAVRVVGPRAAPPGEPVVTRRQVGWAAAALATLWFGSDWPVHDIGERYLYSVHMFQHILFQFAVVPFALLATPTWLARRIVGGGRRYRSLRALSRLVPATLIFNALVIASQVPVVVNRAVQDEALHYGVHALVLGAAVLLWLPVCGPLPELRFTLPVQAGYLLLQTIVPTLPAAALTMAEGVVYESYRRAGKIWGMTTVYDQQIAGALMTIGEATVLWMLIAVIFIRWATKAQADDRAGGGEPERRAPEADGLTWDEVERALAVAGPAPEEPQPRR